MKAKANDYETIVRVVIKANKRMDRVVIKANKRIDKCMSRFGI